MPHFVHKALSPFAEPFHPKLWLEPNCMTEEEPPSSYSGSSWPPDRPWILMNEQEPESSCTIRVMSYNILSDLYVSKTMKNNCPVSALNWKYRKAFLLEEILYYKSDLILLQEVETEKFDHYFLPQLKNQGYGGIFCPKSRLKTTINKQNRVDGCAIFYKNDKFILVAHHLMDFRELTMQNYEGGSDAKLDRITQHDNIGLVALFQTKPEIYESGRAMPQTKQPLLVCNTHIHWDPQFRDVKLIQTMMLMHGMKTFVDNILKQSNIPVSKEDASNVIPLLICGDFNSRPDSGVIEYLSSGRVSTNHEDFRGFNYGDHLSKLGNSTKSNEFTHPFQISRAYEDGIMPFTNYSYREKLVIDYIFYSQLHMSVVGVLGPIDSNWLKDNHIRGSPQPGIPSDHLPIVVELKLNRTLPIQRSPPN